MPRKKIHTSTTARVRAFRTRQAEKGLQRFEVALDQSTVEQIERLRVESPVFRGGSMSAVLFELICEALTHHAEDTTIETVVFQPVVDDDEGTVSSSVS
jgi:hypothetical protein